MSRIDVAPTIPAVPAVQSEDAILAIGSGGGSAAPPIQHMDEADFVVPVNDDGITTKLCCPSTAACFLSSLFPFSWLGAGASCRVVPVRQELVVLNFGKYVGVAREPGLYCINPCGSDGILVTTAITTYDVPSLKVLDAKGSPLIVSGVVTYQVKDVQRAALDVGSYQTYIKQQSEVVLKQICSQHPYESSKPGEESLKGEQHLIRTQIVQMFQERADRAGVRILRFEFNELSYAPEIAGSMLVRQQAEAMLDARKVVVEGAVSIAYNAVQHLKQAGITFNESESANLVSNLIVTLCSESRVQPTISLGK